MKYSIEQARLISGYSPRELAERLNLTEKEYMEYEHYRKSFTMETAYKFSKLTRVPLDLLDFKPQQF